MDTIHLPLEFQEFLKLLTEHRAEYVVIGGFAVSYHGYPRATGDIDLLINRSIDNAGKVIDALVNFGFERASLDPQMFLAENKIVRFGTPPLRIEIHTSISGVEFTECFEGRSEATVDHLIIPFIGLKQLKMNKRASGRYKDLADIENLPGEE